MRCTTTTLALFLAAAARRGAGAWTPVRSVLLVGGTHGNEYNGVWAVKRWRLASQESCGDGVAVPQWSARFETLSVSTLVGNPRAYDANLRFVDDDLNRQFRAADLTRPLADAADDGVAYEANRARAIAAEWGPKGAEAPRCDFCIDLHTTTSNMGVTIIVDQWAEDALEAAAYAVKRLNALPVEAKAGEAGTDFAAARRPNPVDAQAHVARLLVMEVADRDASPFLSSIGRGGLQIEVGPTPQGVVRTDVVDSMTLAVNFVLEYLESRNERPDAPMEDEEVDAFLYDHEGKLKWPIQDNGVPAAVVHWSLQGKDYELLPAGAPLFEHLNGSILTYEPVAQVNDNEMIQDIFAGEENPQARYPVFINEGAYYNPKSGLGIGVTRKIKLRVPQPVEG